MSTAFHRWKRERERDANTQFRFPLPWGLTHTEQRGGRDEDCIFSTHGLFLGTPLRILRVVVFSRRKHNHFYGTFSRQNEPNNNLAQSLRARDAHTSLYSLPSVGLFFFFSLSSLSCLRTWKLNYTFYPSFLLGKWLEGSSGGKVSFPRRNTSLSCFYSTFLPTLAVTDTLCHLHEALAPDTIFVL